jgi:hypothetical protein
MMSAVDPGRGSAKLAALAGSEQARAICIGTPAAASAQVPCFTSDDRLKAPDGYVPCNPSVVNKDGQPLILVRTVNHDQWEGGCDIRDSDGLVP